MNGRVATTVPLAAATDANAEDALVVAPFFVTFPVTGVPQPVAQFDGAIAAATFWR
jgi:hypothetical protein